MSQVSQQTEQMRSGKGFIAALDQSGGSTPKALGLYGISEDRFSNEAEMFDLIHQMRARIVRAPAFTGEKVIGAILFEMTMDREFEGKSAASYLWEDRGIVPFLKCDKGLADDEDAVLPVAVRCTDAEVAGVDARGHLMCHMRVVVAGLKIPAALH